MSAIGPWPTFLLAYTRRLWPKGSVNRLWYFARDHSFWSGPALNRRRRKYREIGVAAPKPIEANLTVSYGGKLAAQKIGRGAMLGGRRVGIDNANTRARLKRGNEIIEQAVRLGDFVIHVHQNCNVERIGRQPWIVRLAEADHNVSQTEVAHPTAQAPQIFGYHILCHDAAVGTNDRGQPYDVIAAARANVRDGHPGFDAEQTHDLSCFAGTVALLFVMPDWADNVGDRAIGIWKGGSRRARSRQEILGRDRYGERGGKDGGNRQSHG
jgi:hypothetical protein